MCPFMCWINYLQSDTLYIKYDTHIFFFAFSLNDEWLSIYFDLSEYTDYNDCHNSVSFQ